MFRLLTNRYGMAGIGLVMLLLGIFTGNGDSVDCGGETMQRGEVCVETTNGTTTAQRDFDAQKSDNRNQKLFFIGAGSILLVAGSILIFRGRKANAGRGGAVMAAGGYPPYPPSFPQQGYPPYPPQQGYPPQPYPPYAPYAPQQGYPQQPQYPQYPQQPLPPLPFEQQPSAPQPYGQQQAYPPPQQYPPA